MYSMQASTMSMDERAKVLSITQEEVKGKIPIIVGTGTINPKSVVKQTEQALKYGADARYGTLDYLPYMNRGALID